jgi:hypothetical protein
MKIQISFVAACVLSALSVSVSATTVCDSRTGKCGAYGDLVKTNRDLAFMTPYKPPVSPFAASQAAMAAQVAKQSTASGASCAGYWQGGRCVLNGLVATVNGSPVNVMNQPQPAWSGGVKKQVCTLVYKYKNGRVVGNASSVCKFI